MNPAKTFRLGSALVLLCKNDLTHELCQPFKEYFETLVAVQDYQHLVVDLSDLGEIDESGLHLLVYLNSRVRGHGKVLYILSPPRHFLELLQQKELLRFFNLFRNEDDMLSSLPL
ncbi:STAS domain-containing protein [Halodesulfovibrio marinisediminis]|uniref:STAS domain-containing protein n=1 Tax=Halodesulfovibrio marinisediminis DSM 17456 TaxID=1121457 RepID=A0A1N6I676_9BACT|nr:STAS domain-containing protein [Halodesulfovibrio marinisediminis]SIO27503.1 STAS domain-containing protein [Halodesulfovibrio marinisediminis DSM 17456]